MTTIAFKDGIIAYDSRAINGATIRSDELDKRHLYMGTMFFYSGCVADLDEFSSAYIHSQREIHKSVDVCAFVWDGEKLWRAGCDDGLMWREPVVHKHDAIGSGSHMALIAMDMGATAEQAVIQASKRDTGTGGIIRTFNLETGAITP